MKKLTIKSVWGYTKKGFIASLFLFGYNIGYGYVENILNLPLYTFGTIPEIGVWILGSMVFGFAAFGYALEYAKKQGWI